MKHLSWIEAARDLDCIKCRIAGRSGTMTRKFHQPQESVCSACTTALQPNVKFCPECGVRVIATAPPIVVEFVCEEPGCGDTKGPYIVDTEDAPSAAPAPEPSAPVIPTPEEVAEFSKPERSKRSKLAVEKPIEPIEQVDLIAFCKEKFPAKIEAKDPEGAVVAEFPLRVVGFSIPNAPGAPPNEGVKVSYGQPGPYRAPGQLQAVMRTDVIEEALWCSGGEPTADRIEETLKSLEAAIKNCVRGVPREIHKVVHRPTGPASVQVCGVCGQRQPCGCGTVLKASSMSADPAKGYEAPSVSIAEFVRRSN